MPPTLHRLPTSAIDGRSPTLTAEPSRRPEPDTASTSAAVPAPSAPERLRVVGWPDPVIDKLGYDPRSLYVELFWLGVLGPTSTWLMRRLAAGLEERPHGFDLQVDVMARALGLGGRSGRHSPFQRALARCVNFDLAIRPESTTFAVRRRVPPLPRRHLMRLPVAVQESHRRWMAAAHRGPTLDEVRKRARRLALHLLDSGEAAQSVELELMRFGVHPAIAHEVTIWATGSFKDENGAAHHAPSATNAGEVAGR